MEQASVDASGRRQGASEHCGPCGRAARTASTNDSGGLPLSSRCWLTHSATGRVHSSLVVLVIAEPGRPVRPTGEVRLFRRDAWLLHQAPARCFRATQPLWLPSSDGPRD